VLLWTRTKIKSHLAFLLAKPTPHNVNHDNDRFSMFNKKRDIPTKQLIKDSSSLSDWG
jgi:hypothetical protein